MFDVSRDVAEAWLIQQLAYLDVVQCTHCETPICSHVTIGIADTSPSFRPRPRSLFHNLTIDDVRDIPSAFS